MFPSKPPRGEWGACQFCGVAVPPGSTKCDLCGAAAPLTAQQLTSAPPKVRRRVRLTGALRALIVIVVVVGLAYSLVSVVLQGPPVVADPLTTAAMYHIGAGNITILSGEITGGDYVLGNFTTQLPSGASIQLAVYNSTEGAAFFTGSPSTPAYTIAPTSDGRIVFSAAYTDTFYFVFTNPYPVASHLTVEVWITTTYESNVGDDGFA